MKPADVAHLVTLSSPTVSPDGRRVVVAASHPDLDKDENASRLWMVEVDGDRPARPLTHGREDHSPRFSPDGRWIAFLRTPDGGKPQLHLLPADGGDARVLTDLPGGAGDPVWAPDSASVAFTARVPEAGRYGQDEQVPAGKEPPRRITALQYRLDGLGFLVDRRSHVFVVPLPTTDELPAARQVTDGDHDDSGVAFSPDGQWLAFASARHEGRELDLVQDLFRVRVDGSELQRITDAGLSLGAPAYAADGGTVYAVGEDPGPDRTRWVGTNPGLYAVDVASGRPSRLTDAESLYVEAERLVVTDDGVLALSEHRGALDLLSVPVDGSAPTTLSAGHRRITAVDRAGGVTAVVYSDPSTHGELAVLDADGGMVARTDFGAGLRACAQPLPIVELTATAPDGYPVHGFLVAPGGEGPHPVLLMIHGGPFAAYGWTLFDEAQVYAGAGYAVVYGNPRGSSGYGQAHGSYIRGDVGDRSAADLFALLDHALTRPELDGGRTGVLGGSHGGFMTTWIVGHTNRFRAAVSERAVNAIDSFTGSSDIGWGFADDLYGPDLEQQQAQSPLTYADEIETPLLIIHSEQDWRCPLEQAQRLFVALRRRGATTEMLLFPGEGHELSRSGTPRHRVARFEAILDWFGRHLS